MDFLDDLMAQESAAVVLFFLFLSAYVGLKAEKNRYLATVSGVVVTMFTAAFFSNIGLIPSESPTYDMVWKFFIPLSVPMLLFQANFKRIRREAGPMLVVYLGGVIGTVVGAAVGYLLVYVGPETWKIASMFCGSYIGGSINYVSISQTLDLQDQSLFVSGTAADNVTMALYFATMGFMAASAVCVKAFANPFKPGYANADDPSPKPPKSGLLVENAAYALILSFGFYCVALLVKQVTGLQGAEIIVVTVLTLLYANLWPKQAQKLHSTDIISRVLMMVFFAVIGAGCDLELVVRVAPTLFILTTTIIICQFLFALIVARLCGVGLQETLVACNANAGGAATAAAMATSLRLKHLVVPGILCGTLGYAIGTFVGLSLGELLKGM